MSFFIPEEENDSYADTIDLFNKLGKLERLSHEQGESLKEYEANRDTTKDFAIEMPAGHGKTLVGGLIGEFNRKNNSWRTVYTCATRQLANQTHRLLESYGISSVLLTGKISNFSQIDLGKYKRSEAICVTTYSHIFNIKPKFDDAQIIIFDDAHATEYAINEFWAVDINRYKNPEVFDSVLATLGDSLSPNVKDKLHHGTYDPMTDGIDIISFPQWFNKKDDIRSLLDSKTPDTDLYYAWSRIRSHLNACQIFVSYSNIVIKPIIPPNMKHPAFKDAKERIYMSATLGELGELERMFGVKDIHYIKKFPKYSNKVSGRRLILFPEDHFEGEELNSVIKETIELSNRALVLTPSHKLLENVEENSKKMLPDFHFLKNYDIEDDLKNFTDREKTVLGLAGRYEGIDLKDSDCRLQIMHELPVAVSIEEKFLQDRLNATELLKSKLLTRIVQGLGRCTRSKTDYATVLFTGRYVGDYLFKEEFRQLLPAEIHAEVDFGFSQIKHIKDKQTWHSSINDFFTQSDRWEQAEKFLEKSTNKLSKEKEGFAIKDNAKHLSNSTKDEIDFIYHLWEEQYDKAHQSADKVIKELSRNDELKGYRAWWNYLIASIATAQGDLEKAKTYLTRSLGASDSKVWLDKRDIDLAEMGEGHLYNEDLEIQIERITTNLNSFGERIDKFDKSWSSLIKGLSSKEAKHYEPSLKSLGTFLGFSSYLPIGKGVPDSIWNLNSHWFSFEAKTNIEDINGFIPLEDIRQTSLHRKWLSDEYNITEDKEIKLVMICPKNKIEASSRYASEGIFLNNPSEIIGIANRLEIILRNSLNIIKYGDKSTLRQVLAKDLMENKLTLVDLIETLTNVSLCDTVSN